MTTGVTAFDKTIEKTNIWLNELQTIMGWDSREQAYHALRAVLHAVRDRLLPEEAVDLAAQMPMLVRGFFFERWRIAHKPLKYRDKGPFLAQVRKEAPGIGDAQLERTVTAVFELLAAQIPGGETAQVRRSLPSEIRELWALPKL